MVLILTIIVLMTNSNILQSANVYQRQILMDLTEFFHLIIITLSGFLILCNDGIKQQKSRYILQSVFKRMEIFFSDFTSSMYFGRSY